MSASLIPNNSKISRNHRHGPTCSKPSNNLSLDDQAKRDLAMSYCLVTIWRAQDENVECATYQYPVYGLLIICFLVPRFLVISQHSGSPAISK